MELTQAGAAYAVLAAFFLLAYPRAPILGAVVTLGCPFVKMAPAVCAALGLTECGSRMLLEVAPDPGNPELHPAMVGYLMLVWTVLPIGMQQSKLRGELFDLEGQISFYRSYHTDRINCAIHAVCIPTILWTAMGLYSASAPFFGPGTPGQLDWSIFPAALYSSYYVLMMRDTSLAVGVASACMVIGGWYVHHTEMALEVSTLLYLHVGSWLLQFWGHGVHEKRAPALLSNLSQALLMAPLFVSGRSRALRCQASAH